MKRANIRRLGLVGAIIGAIIGVVGLSATALNMGPSTSTQTGRASFPLVRDVVAAAHYGRIPARRVDPASAGFEGKESSTWDELEPAERITQTEATVAAMLEQLEATDADSAQQRRESAMSILSATRSDYFATDEGASRYLELERAIEDGR